MTPYSVILLINNVAWRGVTCIYPLNGYWKFCFKIILLKLKQIHQVKKKTRTPVPYPRTTLGTQKKIPYLRTENLKNHTLFRGTYLYSPYMGVAPRGPCRIGMEMLVWAGRDKNQPRDTGLKRHISTTISSDQSIAQAYEKESTPASLFKMSS